MIILNILTLIILLLLVFQCYQLEKKLFINTADIIEYLHAFQKIFLEKNDNRQETEKMGEKFSNIEQSLQYLISHFSKEEALIKENIKLKKILHRLQKNQS